jgi:hypothetical protein
MNIDRSYRIRPDDRDRFWIENILLAHAFCHHPSIENDLSIIY